MSESRTMVSEPTRRLTVGRWSAELLPRQSYEARYMANQPVLGFAYESQEGIHALSSDRILPFRARPNALAYIPEGYEVYSRSQSGGEYLLVTGFDPVDGGDAPFMGRIDPLASAAAREVRRLFLSAQAVEPLRYEASMIALLERLRCLRESSARPSRAEQWMTPHRLKRIDDLMEADLGKVTVQKLASELGLSAGFFSRAFKAATGQSPHDYIIDRRLARARALIAAGADDLTAVALEAGFYSHAHLTTVFRQRLGEPPSSLRRSCQNQLAKLKSILSR